MNAFICSIMSLFLTFTVGEKPLIYPSFIIFQLNIFVFTSCVPCRGAGKVPYLNAASFGAGWAVCSCAHVGHGRGLCNKNSSDYRLMQRAMMWQLHISLCELAKQDYGSGQPVFWLKMFPQALGVGSKDPKVFCFIERCSLPQLGWTGHIQFAFSPMGGWLS